MPPTLVGLHELRELLRQLQVKRPTRNGLIREVTERIDALVDHANEERRREPRPVKPDRG